MKPISAYRCASSPSGAASNPGLFAAALVVAFAAGSALGYSARPASSPSVATLAASKSPTPPATAGWPTSNGDPSLPPAAQALQAREGKSNDSGEPAPSF